MGVPGFNTWMRSQYLGAYVPQRSEFDHVYVDMASILHTVLRKGAAPAPAAAPVHSRQGGVELMGLPYHCRCES
jgi:5'-3' exonuclease